MRKRLPLLLSATALAVALLGSTPLGHAAAKLMQTVPPFAKTAGFAKYAGTADNAKKLAGHKASVTPAAGDVPVLGADGKLPVSIGALGPQGLKGDKGDKGDRGKDASSLWAHVDSGGGIIASSKSVGAASRLGAGFYQVTFDRDVSKCAFLATVDGAPNGIAAATQPYGSDPSSVRITTFFNTSYVNSAFSIGVFC